MPWVNIKLAGELSREQKAEIAAEIASLMERVAGKEKQWTAVHFECSPEADWAFGGQLLDTLE